MKSTQCEKSWTSNSMAASGNATRDSTTCKMVIKNLGDLNVSTVKKIHIKGSTVPRFKSRDERKKILAKKGLCFNCTRTQHRANDCKSKLECQKCQRRHHTSICDQTEQFLGTSSSSSVIHPVVIVQVGGYKCRALLDTGAGSSYISVALLDQIPKKCCKEEISSICKE